MKRPLFQGVFPLRERNHGPREPGSTVSERLIDEEDEAMDAWRRRIGWAGGRGGGGKSKGRGREVPSGGGYPGMEGG